MYDQPKCCYCGKFISDNKETLGEIWDCKLVWAGYPIPEPDYTAYWHIKCDNLTPTNPGRDSDLKKEGL